MGESSADITLQRFQTRFRTDSACRAHLFRLRWPDGFRCPACGHEKSYALPRRHLLQCKKCGRQTSVTAGTVMHRTRTPLRVWFWAIYLMARDKRGVSALQLSKRLNVSYYVAWTMLHKIRRAMTERDSDNSPAHSVVVKGLFLGSGPGGGQAGKRRQAIADPYPRDLA